MRSAVSPVASLMIMTVFIDASISRPSGDGPEPASHVRQPSSIAAIAAVDASSAVVWFLDEGAGIRSMDASGSGIDATLGLNARSPAWTSFER